MTKTCPPDREPTAARLHRRHLLKSALAMPMLAGACSPATLVNALVSHRNYTLVADISYEAGPRHSLDIYRPTAGRAPWPVVVFFYGGNWEHGDKGMYLFVGEALAARGFVAVIPDYRVFPEVRFPAFLRDGAAAMEWTLAHIAEFGGDPRSVHLMGHSAGAHIAAMLALDPRWLGPDRARIRSTVGLAGPYDFLPLHDAVLKEIFGTAHDLRTTQPIHYADGSAAPMLLVAGDDDDIVEPRDSKALAAAIRAHGGEAKEIYYPGIGHIGLVAALAADIPSRAPVLDDVAAFLHATS